MPKVTFQLPKTFSLEVSQCVSEILNQVVPVFKPDGKTDAAWFHAQLLFFFLRHGCMRHGVRAFHQRFHLSKTYGKSNTVRMLGQEIDEFLSTTGRCAPIRTILERKVNHRTWSKLSFVVDHLPFGKFTLWKRFEAGIDDFCNLRVALE